MALEPITRAEQIMSGESLEPITREEMFLAKAAGMDVDTPTPITRREMFLSKISGGAGGGSASKPVICALEVTENGTYEAPNGVDGYSPVTVNVAAGGGSDDEWFNDGNTHIWITLHEGRTSPMLRFAFKGTVTVDWGDGTEPYVMTQNNFGVWSTTNHEYGKAGDYIIRVSSSDNITGFGGYDNRSYKGIGILAYSSSPDARNFAYKNAINKIELGNNVTRIPGDAFRFCESLKSIAIPNGITDVWSYAFGDCHQLESITIPNGVATIDSQVFCNCICLKSVILPASVNNISSSSFKGCYSAVCYDFSNHTAVPTLANTNAFEGIPADCEIRVPAAIYDEWIAATNWATYASNIVAV